MATVQQDVKDHFAAAILKNNVIIGQVPWEVSSLGVRLWRDRTKGSSLKSYPELSDFYSHTFFH